MSSVADGSQRIDASTGALSPEARERSIEVLRGTTEPGKELDILIVGGGVVGAGAALDAVTRGLSVGIVEARDWASGTSSRSSKLIHGGLRYLEMLDFALVQEALQERGLLIQQIAPHLVRPVPFLYPLTRRFWERPTLVPASSSTTRLASPPATAAAYPCTNTSSGAEHCGQHPASRAMPSSAPSATTMHRSTTPGWWSMSSARPHITERMP